MAEALPTGLARAQALADANRWAEARAGALRVLTDTPDSVPALCLLGMCELQLGNDAAAERAGSAAAALAPDDDWPHRVRALALARLGRHDEAVAAAQEAIRLEPGLSAGHQVLGHVLLKNPRRGKEALEVARRAVRLDPNDPEAHVLLGIAADRHRHRDEERAAYRRALALDPQNSAALNNLAAMDLDRGRLGRAASQVSSALQLDPQEEVLRQNLDNVAVRLLVRLLNAMLLSGFLLLILVVAEDAGSTPRWWPRALGGTALLIGYALTAWLTLRHLPAGARRYLRGLPRRMTGRAKALWIAFLVLSIAMVVAAFAPGGAAKFGAVIIIIVIRIFQIALVVLLIRWLYRKVTRADRR